MKATTSSSRPKFRRRLGQIALGVFVLILLFVAGIVLRMVIGFHVVSTTDGTMHLAGLRAPVQILRDERGIPHIRAANEHDLFLAQGFAEGSDRLFQIDLTRHFVYGRLSEWFGKLTLSADERSRNIDVHGIVARQWAGLTPKSRAELQAFADGVNAAMEKQPMPFEYRLIFAKPQKWEASDSLGVGFATVLALADSYKDVMQRDEAYRRLGTAGYGQAYPLSDPRYDAPTVGSFKRHDSDLHALKIGPSEPRTQNSNEWAAGSAHTSTGRALLANDPHLDLSIPGIWYLVDLQAPGFHVAGASLAGTPGVILGHNDHIAWGATNGTVAALSLFRIRGHAPQSAAVTETFVTRLRSAVSKTYYRDARGFYVDDAQGQTFLVAWSAFNKPGSPLDAFDGLDRARSMDDGLKALAKYPGPTQNFVLASTDGRAAYTLAGWIPNDPVWARYAHTDAYRNFPMLPFSALPHIAPSRNAVVFTSNNRMYGDGYRYRLSATFAPPYRAFEVWRLLQARKKYDVDYFARMQNDTYSVAELELTRFIIAAAHRHPELLSPAQRTMVSDLQSWDGKFTSDSRKATLAHAMRLAYQRSFPTPLASKLQLLRMGPKGQHLSSTQFDRQLLYATLHDVAAEQKPWGEAGAVPMLNPLHGFGIGWLDGAVLPGEGDNYTVHAESTSFNQSFRAVWDVGNWDAGGIVIPAGESGQPPSPHYQDLTSTYESGKLMPLPYSAAAVERHAATRQTLLPAP